MIEPNILKELKSRYDGIKSGYVDMATAGAFGAYKYASRTNEAVNAKLQGFIESAAILHGVPKEKMILLLNS